MNDREYVASLIIKVITGQMLVRDAVRQFPKDTSDINIITTYHALIHYEADEEYRLTDSEYKEEQNNYLIFIAEKLNSNSDLPKNIIKEYEPFYPLKHINHSTRFKNIIKSLCKFLNI